MTDYPGQWRDDLHWHDHALRKFPDWTVEDLVEAYNDPNRVVIRPDPKSETECCATSYPAKGRDLRLYRGEDGEPQ